MKKILLIFLLASAWGYGLCHLIETNKQAYINEQLKFEYDNLKAYYDVLVINYKLELELAREYIIKLEDNRYDVNLDGEVNDADYMAIKNYILNKD